MTFVPTPIKDDAELYACQQELALLKDIWCAHLHYGAFLRADETKLSIDQINEAIIAYQDQAAQRPWERP